MACNAIVNSLKSNNDTNHTTLNAIIAGASIYYNFTGKMTCLNLDSGDDIGADMWDYQVKLLFCTCGIIRLNFYYVLQSKLLSILQLKIFSYFVVIFSNALKSG